MELKEKAAYLKGLADGLEFDKTTAEGKLLVALIDIVNELATEVEGTQEDVNYLNEYVEEIDQDLGDVEEAIFGDDEDDEDFDPDDYFDTDDFDDEEDGEEDSEDKDN